MEIIAYVKKELCTIHLNFQNYLSYNNFISNNFKTCVCVCVCCFYLTFIVNATCVLHNIAKHFNILDDAYRDKNIEEIELILNANLHGRRSKVRERIIQYFTLTFTFYKIM